MRGPRREGLGSLGPGPRARGAREPRDRTEVDRPRRAGPWRRRPGRARRAVTHGRSREIIERQADQLTRLVDDLLDVTRIARGKLELRRARLDLAAVVRGAGEDHGPLFAQRGLALAVAVPGAPAWIDGDATRIGQLVGNLLQNAARYTPQGGTVSLSLAAVDGRAEIRVRDSGAGISPELLWRVFQPFEQAEPGGPEGGLGLGLALVKGIAELHGGTARGESAGAGCGAEFIVTLPLAQ